MKRAPATFRAIRAGGQGLLLVIACATGAVAQSDIGDDQARQLNPLAAFDPSTLTGFIERPLFAPSRQVAAEPQREAVQAEPPPAESFNFRLLGVVETPRGLIARIADLDAGTAHSLRDGEAYRDWTVVAVEKASLKLSRDGAIMDLALFVQAPPPTAGATPAQEPTETPLVDSLESKGPVRVIPGATGAPASDVPAAPQWTEQDLIDVFGPRERPPG